MAQIVVSHGYGARDDSVWFPYLAERMAAAGHQVAIPQLPDTAAPRLDPWRTAYGTAVRHAGPPTSTILVGHSIGGVNVLRFLEQHNPETSGVFAGAVLVATAAFEVGYDELAEFFADGFDWPRIRRAARAFRVLQALDDPVNQPDPTVHVRHFVEGLGAVAVITPGGGHFGAAPDDHVEVPEVLRLITEVLPGKPD